jgi:cytochrome c oxidase subunit 2
MIACAIVLTGCSGPLSTLEPAGPAAASIAALWWTMFWGATILFTLVMALLLLAFVRPDLGSRISGRGWVIGGGVAMPITVLMTLVGFALFQGERLLPAAADAPLRIEVTARRWAWEFNYPDVGGAPPTIDILHVPSGRAIDLAVRSADIIHSFWIPRLGGKIDATPGHTTLLRLRAEKPGLYRGVCSEFCGTGHATMWFHVQAHPSEEYEAIVRAIGKSEASQ